MLNRREMGYLRVGGPLVVTAALALSAVGYSIRSIGPDVRVHAVMLQSLTFKQTTTVGGDAHPVELDIAFTGTPGQGDVVRLRPEKNDPIGWRIADPIKDTDATKVHMAFNTKDDKGPYVDVTLAGTSPQTVILDTSNPDKDRADTFLTGKIGDGNEVQSNKITISHDAG